MPKFIVKSVLIACLFLIITPNLQTNLSQAQTPGVDDVEEIVVIGADTYVYVYKLTQTNPLKWEVVFQSPENGWEHVATADLNNDKDHEIIVTSRNKVKVYDPQIIGTEFTFEATYGSLDSRNFFTKVDAGNFFGEDPTLEIALTYSNGSRGDTHSRIIIYKPPQTSPEVDELFTLSDWDDFAVGDYDGDGDDDFALTYWNQNYPDDNRSWFELRKGKDPDQKLEGTNNAGTYSNSEWFDIASGEFSTANGTRDEWVGTQNIGKVIVAQRWDDDEEIRDIWSRDDKGGYEYLAVSDFRGENDFDQVAMLRNLSTSSSLPSLQFIKNRTVWSSITGLGTGWIGLESGNVDAESNFKEAIALKADIIRIYLQPQAGSSGQGDFLDCNRAGNCFEIAGSFLASIAVGDLGTVFTVKRDPVAFSVSPTKISRTVDENQAVSNQTITISGEYDVDEPLAWRAGILPDLSVPQTRQLLRDDPDLILSITEQEDAASTSQAFGTIHWPDKSWISLSAFEGTTTPTQSLVTTIMTNTGRGFYQATILFWRQDLPEEDRFRFVDVSLLVGAKGVYLPMVIK